MLFHHFLGRGRARRFNRPKFPEVREAHMANLMTARSWPGNVRELGNAAERYALGLSEMQVNHGSDGRGRRPAGRRRWKRRLDAFERQVICGDPAPE